MKKIIPYIPNIVSYFFILLFFYAAISKVIDFENFQVQIGQSPLLTAYASIISYSVIIVEIIVVFLLAFPKTKISGLYFSLGLMFSFTIYIYVILNYSEFIPCSCGGILEKMDWTEHLVFNILCIVLALIAVIIEEKIENYTLKSTFLLIFLTILISGLIVIYLYISSEHIVKKENNFTRRYFPNALIEINRSALEHQYYYFAGNDANHVYLGDITSPLKAKKLSLDLKDLSDFNITLDSYDHTFKNLKLQVRNSNFFLYDGSLPIIYQGNLSNNRAKTISFKDVYFNQLTVIDSSRFVFRTISASTKSFELGILDLKISPRVLIHSQVLDKQSDGIFDSDGSISFIPETKKIIYTYAYRNQIAISDDHLENVRFQNTIDTTTIAKIEVKTLSDGRTKMQAPPFKVNKLQTPLNQFLLNESDLMGKNESVKRWKTNSTIDIYDTENNKYVGSFYIPYQKKNKLSNLLYFDNKLYVLVGNEIIVYQFRDTLRKALK